jgi:membrane protease YdiL (CAAX protease family)
MVFEGALIFVALGAGWVLSFDPLATMRWSHDDLPALAGAVGWGFLATVPMIAGLLVIDLLPVGPLGELRRLSHHVVLPLFRRANLGQLAMISLLAGLGEEMLFRGLLQAGLSQWIGGLPGMLTGLAVASLLFGLCHAVRPVYAVFAILIGFYFGLLFLWTGNLVAPIITHGLYDFVALTYLRLRNP